jgi:hypothetical protein
LGANLRSALELDEVFTENEPNDGIEQEEECNTESADQQDQRQRASLVMAPRPEKGGQEIKYYSWMLTRLRATWRKPNIAREIKTSATKKLI